MVVKIVWKIVWKIAKDEKLNDGKILSFINKLSLCYLIEILIWYPVKTNQYNKLMIEIFNTIKILWLLFWFVFLKDKKSK